MFDDIIAGIRYIWDLTKASDTKGPARIGEVRHWHGGDYKKHGVGDWRPVPGGANRHFAQSHDGIPGDHRQVAKEKLRVSDELARMEHDERKYGNAKMKERHLARMHRMAESIDDPAKAHRRAVAFYRAGEQGASRIYQARAIELAGESKAPTPTQVPSPVGVPAAALQSQLGPAAHSAPSEKKPGYMATDAIRQRVMARAQQEPASSASAAAPHLAAGNTQVSQAERQQIAHLKQGGDPAALKAAQQARLRRKKAINNRNFIARQKAIAAAKTAPEELAQRAQLSQAEHQRIAQAEAGGDPAVIAAAKKDRLRRKKRDAQHRHLRKRAALAAAGQAVPVRVPAAAGAAKPGKKEPSQAKSSGTKSSPALAGHGLSAPDWISQSDTLEAQMGQQKLVAWSTTLGGKGREEAHNVNATFFNKLADGTTVCWKPHDIGYGIDYLRNAPGMKYYDTKVREVEREKCAYELDRALGIGMTPPVVVREETIPEKYMKELMNADDNGVHLLKHLDPPYTGKGDWKTKGSAMYVVDKCKWWCESRMDGARADMSKKMADLPSHTQFDLQKMACFDFITGTTDRHARNVLIDPDGRLVAIDHGLCFPRRGNEDAPGRGFSSVAFTHVTSSSLGTGGRLDPKILNHLKTIRKDDVMNVMKAHGMAKEGEHCWMRLQAIVRLGRLTEAMKDDASVWHRPWGVV